MPRVIFEGNKDVVYYNLNNSKDFNWKSKALFSLFSILDYKAFRVQCPSEKYAIKTYNQFIELINRFEDSFKTKLSIIITQSPSEVEVRKGVLRKLGEKIRSRRESRDSSTCANTGDMGSNS